MNKLPRFSVKYPTTVMMVVLAILLLGYISFQRLGIDLLPDLNSPRLYVEIEAGEIPPVEMEELFVSRMEAIIARGKNVKDVISISRVGKALITVEYQWNTDMDEAYLDLQKSMADFSQNTDADEITVSQHNPNSDPIMVVILSSTTKNPTQNINSSGSKKDNGSNPTLNKSFSGVQGAAFQKSPLVAEGNLLNLLRKIAENNIRNRLVRLGGVAGVELVGELRREVHICTDSRRLESFGLTIDQVSSVVKGSNRSISGGSVVEMGVKYIIRGIGEFETIEDIRGLIVANRAVPGGGKSPIYLRDVADVEFSYSEPENMVLLNGKRCIALEIFKESGFNTIEASKGIRGELEDLGRSLPGFRLQVIRDQAGFIDAAVSEVEETGLVGIFLAVLVLFFFLRRVGVTAVVSIAIPISVVATFNLMYFNDLTLNIMTLGGLALGAGMLVDNAIIVVENIFRHQEKGKSILEAAVDGTAEVGGAITSSTLTTIIVFLPIVYLHGASGELFKEQAWTVAFSLFSSLFVALAVIPMLYSKLIKKAPGVSTPRPIKKNSVRFAGYGKFLEGVLRKRGLVVIVAVLVVIGTVLVVPYVGSEFFPHTGEGELIVDLTLPEGTALERTEGVVGNIEKMVRGHFGDDIEFVYSRVGPSGSSGSETDALLDENNATIELVLNKDSDTTTKDLSVWLEKHLAELPDVKSKIKRGQTALQTTLGTDEAPLVVEIKGKDLDTLKVLSEKVKAKMSGFSFLGHIETSFQGGRPEIDIEIDGVAAAQYNLQAENIGTQLKNALIGVDSGRITESGEMIDIKLKTPDISPERLAGILLETSTGQRVRLDQVALLKRTVSPREITRKNQVRTAEIKAHLKENIPFDHAAEKVQKAVSEVAMPLEYSFAVTGEEKLREESFGNLTFAMLLAVILVYMVMAAQFESLLHPFVILLTIPLAFVGAVFLQLVLGMPFNIMSFIGMIMLAGIAVNDSIILVDRINRNRREGMELRSAIILAGTVRIRPIIMTSVTTILALLPLTIGIGEGAALRAPMAVAVIGGLFSSTVLTLVVIPCVYSFFASGGQGLFPIGSPCHGAALDPARTFYRGGND